MPETVPSADASSGKCCGGSVRPANTQMAATTAAIAITTRFIRWLKAGVRLERRRFVGPLPRELRLGAAEMAERGRLLVDRPAQIQLVDDPARRELEVRADDPGDLFLRDPASAFRVHHDRDRIRDADG